MPLDLVQARSRHLRWHDAALTYIAAGHKRGDEGLFQVRLAPSNTRLRPVREAISVSRYQMIICSGLLLPMQRRRISQPQATLSVRKDECLR